MTENKNEINIDMLCHFCKIVTRQSLFLQDRQLLNFIVVESRLSPETLICKFGLSFEERFVRVKATNNDKIDNRVYFVTRTDHLP